MEADGRAVDEKEAFIGPMGLGGESLCLGKATFRGMEVVCFVQLRQITSVGRLTQGFQGLCRRASPLTMAGRMKTEPGLLVIDCENVKKWSVQMSRIPEMTPLGKVTVLAKSFELRRWVISPSGVSK